MIETETTNAERTVYRHFRAGLRIGGDDLDVDEVSRALGLAPTHTHRKGEPHGKGVRSNTIWIFEPAIDETRPLDEHIMAIWNAVRPNISFLHELKKKFHVDIFVAIAAIATTLGFKWIIVASDYLLSLKFHSVFLL